MCYKKPYSLTCISDVSIPFDELPRAFNPPEGYVVTANNAVVRPGSSYFLSMDWASWLPGAANRGVD